MKKSIFCLIFAFFSLFCFGFSVVPIGVSKAETKTENFNVTAKSALVIEYETGTVVFEKNSTERLPIASMTKLATLSIIFDAISKGIIKENDIVNVSETAAAVGGSTAFLDAGSAYKVCDLIKTVVVASANDSSVALAEHLAGTEEVFVSRMNKFAKSLNLQDTHFENCTGLPKENHYSSAQDMACIYKTICNNELYKKYSKIWMDDFIHPSGRRTGLVNTNRLVKTFDGIEGGKTGYTDAAKFCLTASAKRGDMRLIGVVIGVEDSKTRFAEMSKLLNYGFSNFKNEVIARSDVPVTVARFANAKQQVLVYTKRDCVKFSNKTDETNFSTDFKIDEISAPIKSGDVVGKLYVFDKNNMVVDEIDLIVKQNVEAVGFKELFGKLVSRW